MGQLKEKMRISDLEAKLKSLREQYGDLPVALSVPHDYWGSLESHLDERGVSYSDSCALNGPKNSKTEEAIIIEREF